MIPTDCNRIPVNTKLLTRFFSKIRIDPAIAFNGIPCWIWTACIVKTGYTSFHYKGRDHTAHRIAHGMFVHIIPNGYHGDHLCRNPICVNPIHIESVPPRINTLRGNAPSATHARKTHCIRGHKFTEENTYRYGPEKRFRGCRKCSQAVHLKYRPRTGRFRTHCRKGHLYTQSPTGSHRCLICRQATIKKFNAKAKKDRQERKARKSR